tara:strand:+ start:7986 stop:8096 length:111 start_codon:yes stop_codon:yes gene_type:complete
MLVLMSELVCAQRHRIDEMKGIRFVLAQYAMLMAQK